jgi:hypothetical protein
MRIRGFARFRSARTILFEKGAREPGYGIRGRAPALVDHMSNRSFRARLRRFAAALCFLALMWPLRVAAQLSLPGASAPTEAGAVVAPSEGQPHAAKPRTRPRDEDEAAAAGPAIAPKPPSEDGVVDKQLFLDGSRSIVELQHAGGRLQVARLTLAGDSISRSGESCRVEVEGMPLALKPRDDDSGLHRYQAEFPACPFTLAVLDGAILVSNEGGACELKAADCRSDPRGLWGESDFDPKQAKEMLGLRARVEKTVRANFRALSLKYKKDKDIRNYLASAQAGFSARREEICRYYAKEEDVGYCSLRVTEARALTLAAQLANGVTRPTGLPAETPGQKRLWRVGR